MFRDDRVALADHVFVPGNTPATAPLSDIFHRINYASDLHIDFEGVRDDFFIENPAPTLIIAGDIGEVRHYHQERFQSFFKRASEHWNDVLLISGNHEHYNNVFDTTINKMREATREFVNFTVLEKSSIEINGVVFAAATMWTDFNHEDTTAIAAAQWAMNDYRCIKAAIQSSKPISPWRTFADNREAVRSLTKIVEENSTKPVVVFTHHAPSMKSVDPDYVDEPLLNFAYASDMDQFITDHPNIVHWIHGHMHTRKQYRIGETTVSVNARGYPNQFNDYYTFKPAEIFV